MTARLRTRISVALMALVAAAFATTVIPIPVEEMTRRADLVVEGRAIASRAQWNPQHSLIHTYTRFQIMRSLKGTAPSTLIVKQLGGSAGGFTQHVAGIRHWRIGEEAVLFLRSSDANDGTMAVVGLMQGAFSIHRMASDEARVSNGMPASLSKAESVGPVTDEGGVDTGPAMRLVDLETRVLKVAQE